MCERKPNDVELMSAVSPTVVRWGCRGILTFIYIWRQSSDKHLAGVSLHALPVEVREAVGWTQTGQPLVTWLVLSKGPFVLHGEQRRMTWWTKGFGLPRPTFWTSVGIEMSVEDETQKGNETQTTKTGGMIAWFWWHSLKAPEIIGGEGFFYALI